MALAGPLVALLIQRALWPLLHTVPFTFFFLAVMVAGWWGGWGPAIASIVLTLLAIGQVFRPSKKSSASPWAYYRMDMPLHRCVLLSARSNELLEGREVLGKPLRQGAPEFEAQGLAALVDRVYTTGEPFSAEEVRVRVAREDGSQREIFVNVSLQPTHDAEGRVDGVASFAFDVTELVLSRRQAEEAEKSLQRLADSIPAIVWSAGPDGRNEYYNRKWYEYTGIPQGSLDFELAVQVSHPEDLAANGPRWTECLERGEPFQGEFRLLRGSDYRLRRADGEYRWVNDSATPRFSASGEFLGYIGSMIDVTDRKRSEELLALLARAGAELGTSLDEKETLTAAAELAVPTFADWCPIDLRQEDGSFQRVRVVHADPGDAELARQALRFSLNPEGNVHHPSTQALLQGQTLLFEHFTPESLARSGHTQEHVQGLQQAGLVSCIAVPLAARGSTLGVLSFFTSRSGRHYTEEDRPFAEELARRVALSVDNARLYESAQEAVRLRDEFLSVASHELKTPLTPLSLKLQVLAQKAAAQPESPFAREVLAHVEMGRKQVRKLGELIGDLLDVSRISAGRMKLSREPVDFAALVREVVARYEAQADRQGILLEAEAPPSLVGTWDAMRLEQVVVNLVDNALKYGPGKPVRLRLVEDSGNAVLTVKDEGIGIALSAQGRIFERFMRAVSERNYGGLGLGLYITKSCVSEPGQGALFTVVLPRGAHA